MSQIFFRTYLGTISAIVIVNVLSMLILGYGYEARTVQESKQLARGTVHLILLHLEGKSLSEQQTLVENLRSKFDYSIQLVPWYNVLFTEEESNQLLKEDLIIRHDPILNQTGVYALEPTNKYLLYLGPVQSQFEPIQHLWTNVIISLVIIGFVVFFLIRPIELRLAKLEKTATRLAHGDLSVRLHAAEPDAIGHLEGTFNYMADRIESLIRSQQELTNAVSHELRTPIARIRFELEMLNMAMSQTEQERRLQEIDNDLSDLDKLIDELLTYAKLGVTPPPMRFDEIVIEELLEDICEHLMPIHPDIHYQWTKAKTAPERVGAEAHYLQRAVHNLISNASRYAKTQVQVFFDVMGENNLIYVDDDGLGIPKEDRERIFSPFTRLDTSRNRETGNYGLGLAIVRRIIRWHQGKVWIEDSPLGGARFILSWPKNPSVHGVEV